MLTASNGEEITAPEERTWLRIIDARWTVSGCGNFHLKKRPAIRQMQKEIDHRNQSHNNYCSGHGLAFAGNVEDYYAVCGTTRVHVKATYH